MTIITFVIAIIGCLLGIFNAYIVFYNNFMKKAKLEVVQTIGLIMFDDEKAGVNIGLRLYAKNKPITINNIRVELSENLFELEDENNKDGQNKKYLFRLSKSWDTSIYIPDFYCDYFYPQLYVQGRKLNSDYDINDVMNIYDGMNKEIIANYQIKPDEYKHLILFNTFDFDFDENIRKKLMSKPWHLKISYNKETLSIPISGEYWVIKDKTSIKVG